MPTQISEVVQHLRRAILRQDQAGLTDGQLLCRFVEHRDEVAVTALVRRHGPMVWGVCRRILPNHHDAEDAFQATFLVLVRRAASITPREMVGNWLHGVAHQTAIKARAMLAKRRTREKQVTAMPQAQAPEQDARGDLQPVLDQELSRLPEKYRVAIVLCDLEGKTRKDAARQLGLPEGTLAGRLTRGRKLLAKRLARHGFTLSGGALATVLTQKAAFASVPASVMSSTIKAVTLVAAGPAAAPGVISGTVAALTEGVIKAMFLNKLMKVTAVLLAAVAVVGSGGLLYRTQAAEPGIPRTQPAIPQIVAEKKPKADKNLEALHVLVEQAKADVASAEARLNLAKEQLKRAKQTYEAAKNARPAAEEKNSDEADDVADVPAQDLRAGKDENKRYFLIGPRKDSRAPRQGYGLVVILPGGPGSADFHPFVKRIYKYAVPDGYLVAQPVAVKWTDEQVVVWPTEKNPAEKMKFSTEKFVAEVIKEVAAKHKLNPKKVFTLSWSSSGPAAYAISLTDKTVRGSFIAMSVFDPERLPSLEKARGHAYYLYHSPDDRLCPYRMAQRAVKDLEKNDAKVKLKTYDGGHGWRAGLYDHMRQGIAWLEKNRSAAAEKK